MDKREFWKEFSIVAMDCKPFLLSSLGEGYEAVVGRWARWRNWNKVKDSGMGNTVLHQKYFKEWLLSVISISLQASLLSDPRL